MSKQTFKKVLRPGLRRNGKPGERVLMPYPATGGKGLVFLPDEGAEVVATSASGRYYWLAALACGDVEEVDQAPSSKVQKTKRPKPEPSGDNRPLMAGSKE